MRSSAVHVSTLPLPLLLVLASLVTAGCYTAQLDPDALGVFVCGDPDEGADATCPASQTCVNQRCEDADDVPVVVVLNPEDEEAFTNADLPDGMMLEPPFPRVDLPVSIQGSIDLVAVDTDPVFGQGYVTVAVDGQMPTIIDSGSISDSTPVMMQVDAIAGPHRIKVQAFRSDGVAYDNPEATATRLFWFESDLIRRPFVAIKSPWPGTVFGPEDQTVEIELATLNFELVEPNPGSGKQDGRGHAHIFYGDRVVYPECVHDMACDNAYLGVIGQSRTGTISIPMSGAQGAAITAALRNTDHSPYGFPFGCDPAQATMLDACAPVFDAVDVLRATE